MPQRGPVGRTCDLRSGEDEGLQYRAVVDLIDADSDQLPWRMIASQSRSTTLAGFVQRSGETVDQIEVARPAVTVLFVLSGEMRLGGDDRPVRSAAVGLRSLPLRSSSSSSVECVEMNLSPLQMFALCGGRPMDEIADGIADLDDIAVRPMAGLHERVASTSCWSDRFDLVHGFVDEAMGVDQGSAEIRHAWWMLSATGGRAGVGELCSATGWSAKRLRARFRREIGVTPKQAGRLIRFGLAHDRLTAGVAPSIVAAEGGFADQSHLHRDVLGFSGMTPGKLAARPHGF